jgi:hypothetical protein
MPIGHDIPWLATRNSDAEWLHALADKERRT